MRYYEIKDFLNLKKLKNLEINESQINQICSIISKYDKKSLNNYIDTIVKFIIYDVSFNEISWLDRFDIIKNRLGRDSSSLYSHQIRYGVEMGNKLFNEKNMKCKPSINKYVDEFGCDLGYRKWRERYSLNGNSIEIYMKRFGNDGEFEYLKYLDKRSNSYLNNKKNGRKYDNGLSLSSFINRYGEELGEIKYRERFSWYKDRYCREFYIDKYGDIEGDLKWNEYLKNMSKTSLESYVNRYGEELGKCRFDRHVTIAKYKNSLEYYEEKYGNELGRIKWDEYRNRTIFKKSRYSKISQELFWKIYDELSDDMKKMCYFAEHNTEYFIRDKSSIKFLDFKIGNVVIEFDGSYWHSIDAVKINDILKNEMLFNLGYSLLRIDENEYIKNRKGILERCLMFINENYE